MRQPITVQTAVARSGVEHTNKASLCRIRSFGLLAVAKYVPLLFLALLISALVFSHAALAQCSAEDISSYVAGGATAEQLSQLCGQSMGVPTYSQQPTVATLCVTQWGFCPLMVQLPFGSYCECFTLAGRVPGLAR
jgi:hypothetical protein